MHRSRERRWCLRMHRGGARGSRGSRVCGCGSRGPARSGAVLAHESAEQSLVRSSVLQLPLDRGNEPFNFRGEGVVLNAREGALQSPEFGGKLLGAHVKHVQSVDEGKVGRADRLLAVGLQRRSLRRMRMRLMQWGRKRFRGSRKGLRGGCFHLPHWGCLHLPRWGRLLPLPWGCLQWGCLILR